MLKKILIYLRTILYIASLIIFLIFIFNSSKFKFSSYEFISITAFVVFMYILEPLFHILLQKTSVTRLNLLILLTKIVLSTLFILSLYRIFDLDNTHLYTSYYIVLLTVTLYFILGAVDSIRNYYKTTVLEGKPYKLRITCTILLYSFSFLIYLSGAITLFYKPVIVASLHQIQTPNRIEIRRESDKKETSLDYMNLVVASISDSQEINIIINDLKKEDVQSLSATEYLDYYRTQTLDKTIFHISLYYTDYKLNNQYFSFIEFNSKYEAMAVAIDTRDYAGLLRFFRPYSSRISHYPIKLSKETIDILSGYVTAYED